MYVRFYHCFTYLKVEAFLYLTNTQTKAIQKPFEEGYTITGTDVSALFPSITDVEAARI